MPSPEQLDIFAHSAEVMLRNDAIDGLERRDPAAARVAMRALTEAFPDDADLASFEYLTGLLEANRRGPLESFEAVSAERQALAHDVARCVQEVFGRKAEAWLRPQWGTLAERSAKLPFVAGIRNWCNAAARCAICSRSFTPRAWQRGDRNVQRGNAAVTTCRK